MPGLPCEQRQGDRGESKSLWLAPNPQENPQARRCTPTGPHGSQLRQAHSTQSTDSTLTPSQIHLPRMPDAATHVSNTYMPHLLPHAFPPTVHFATSPCAQQPWYGPRPPPPRPPHCSRGGLFRPLFAAARQRPGLYSLGITDLLSLLQIKWTRGVSVCRREAHFTQYGCEQNKGTASQQGTRAGRGPRASAIPSGPGLPRLPGCTWTTAPPVAVPGLRLHCPQAQQGAGTHAPASPCRALQGPAAAAAPVSRGTPSPAHLHATQT